MAAVSNTNPQRIFRALSKQGLDVSYDQSVYKVRLKTASTEVPTAEILLPPDLPVEGNAFLQLAQIATIHHPLGGHNCGVRRVLATPDFHHGDSGVPIGSVVMTEGMVAPSLVGKDIGCGMRLHLMDLDVGEFKSNRDKLVEKLKGDYFFGTRDVVQSTAVQIAMFNEGLLGWTYSQEKNPLGCVSASDWGQLNGEIEKVFGLGSMKGNTRWIPDNLIPPEGSVRDPGLATIGGGNHFVEIQVIEEIEDASAAWELGIKKGQMAFMIHSGSRHVGGYVGQNWADKARESWPQGVAYPDCRLFPLIGDQIESYLEAENTAANYSFVNRTLLAELLRLRFRQVFGSDLEMPLVYDLPHNITLREGGPNRLVSRKGACPAHAGQLVIIPGSMGTPSYLLKGLGNENFLSSASHGAGRAKSRNELFHTGSEDDEVDCVALRPERKIEEAPSAYKPIIPVIESQVKAGIVKVVAKLSPILTFKA